jgi:hypothetical protein
MHSQAHTPPQQCAQATLCHPSRQAPAAPQIRHEEAMPNPAYKEQGNCMLYCNGSIQDGKFILQLCLCTAKPTLISGNAPYCPPIYWHQQRVPMHKQYVSDLLAG